MNPFRSALSAICRCGFAVMLGAVVLAGITAGCNKESETSATTTKAPANQGPGGSSLGYTVAPEQQSQIQAAQKADAERAAAMQNQQTAPKK